MARNSTNADLTAVRWPLRLTRLGMVCERAFRAFWPLWSVLAAVLAVLMLGVQDLVAVDWVWGGAAASAILAVGFLWRGLRQFTVPTRADAISRLDQTLPGAPLQAVQDHPATGADDPASLALWRAHLARMQQKLQKARAVRPDLHLARFDPFALRYVALLLLSVGLLFGSVIRVQSVTHMGFGRADLAQGPSWEGWMMPPQYTGLPTVYLNDITSGEIASPEGSEIRLRLYGSVGVLTISETVSGAPLENDDTETARDFQVARSGEVTINGRGGQVWQIAMIPDMAPSVEVDGTTDVTYEGEATIPFSARDDHGVVSGTAWIELDLAAVDRRFGRTLAPEPRDVISAPLPIPVVGDRRDFTQPLVGNFSQHPWAHLPVKLRLEVMDDAGNTGTSQQHDMILPGRRFFDPLATVVIEIRQALLWNRDYAKDAAQIMRAVGNHPNSLFRKEIQQMRYEKIMTRMERLASLGMTDQQQEELAQSLWDLALELEEIDLDDARERLERARERLEEAMKNGASQDQIDRLMQELREATNDYLRQLGQEQARQEPQPQQGDPRDQMTMSMDDLQAMRDRIQELMEQGRMDEAMEALRQYNEMIENMQITQGGQGQGGQSPGEQAMEGLSETLRDQQDLSDEAFRDLQKQFNPQGRQDGRGAPQPGQPNPQGQGGDQQNPGQQGQNGQQTPQQSLADRQRALRQELNRQRQALPGQGTEGGQSAAESLDRAENAMRGAEEALREGDLGEAIDQQSQAMEALRDGMRGLGDAMAQQQQNQQGQSQQQGEARGGDSRGQNDPLGRTPGQNGNTDSADGMLQGEDVYRRAEELLDELRRRSGQAERPEVERDYLDRLLERF